MTPSADAQGTSHRPVQYTLDSKVAMRIAMTSGTLTLPHEKTQHLLSGKPVDFPRPQEMPVLDAETLRTLALGWRPPDRP